MEVIATHHGNVGMLRSMRSSAFDAYIGPPHIAVDGQHAGENLILLKQVPELGVRVHAALSGPVADSDAVILGVRQHTRRCGSSAGRAHSRTPFRRVNIAVLAPITMANVRTAMRWNSGLYSSA